MFSFKLTGCIIQYGKHTPWLECVWHTNQQRLKQTRTLNAKLIQQVKRNELITGSDFTSKIQLCLSTERNPTEQLYWENQIPNDLLNMQLNFLSVKHFCFTFTLISFIMKEKDIKGPLCALRQRWAFKQECFAVFIMIYVEDASCTEASSLFGFGFN